MTRTRKLAIRALEYLTTAEQNLRTVKVKKGDPNLAGISLATNAINNAITEFERIRCAEADLEALYGRVTEDRFQ